MKSKELTAAPKITTEPILSNCQTIYKDLSEYDIGGYDYALVRTQTYEQIMQAIKNLLPGFYQSYRTSEELAGIIIFRTA